jgi:hypothetical protein
MSMRAACRCCRTAAEAQGSSTGRKYGYVGEVLHEGHCSNKSKTAQSANLAITSEGIASSPDATVQGDSLAAASEGMQASPDAAVQDEDLTAAPEGMQASPSAAGQGSPGAEMEVSANLSMKAACRT